MAENPLLKLKGCGQSPWYDNIERELILSGGLLQLITEDGIVGVTSNPSIFEKAIGSGAAYDDHIRQLVSRDLTLDQIFDELTTTDVRLSCDVFAPSYERAAAADGYASLEVSPEIANDTETTERDARRLFAALDRPNAMIKIPGTPAGLQAIEDCLADGLNINITLLFGVDNYEQVALRYLTALERRVAAGQPVDRISSVASFFVSRVDTNTDKLLDAQIAATTSDLEKRRLEALRGKAGVANAKIAYAKFKEIFSGPRWDALAARGARVQRPLWASTGTKNPAYSDVLYIEELIGPDTINTMPQATLEAFRDHGIVRDTLEQDVDASFRHVEELREVGIDLHEVTDALQVDGVKLFSDAFANARATVERKCVELKAEMERGIGAARDR
jgi:transaldolase